MHEVEGVNGEEGEQKSVCDKASSAEFSPQSRHGSETQTVDVLSNFEYVANHYAKCCVCGNRNQTDFRPANPDQQDGNIQAPEKKIAQTDNGKPAERSRKRNSIGNLKQKLGRVTGKLGTKQNSHVWQTRPRSQSVFDFRGVAVGVNDHVSRKMDTSSRHQPDSIAEESTIGLEQRRVKRHSFNCDAPLIERWTILENMANSFDTVSLTQSLSTLTTKKADGGEEKNICDAPNDQTYDKAVSKEDAQDHYIEESTNSEDDNRSSDTEERVDKKETNRTEYDENNEGDRNENSPITIGEEKCRLEADDEKVNNNKEAKRNDEVIEGDKTEQT